MSMKLGVRGTHRSRLGLFVVLGLSAALLLAVLAATGGAMLRGDIRSRRAAPPRPRWAWRRADGDAGVRHASRPPTAPSRA